MKLAFSAATLGLVLLPCLLSSTAATRAAGPSSMPATTQASRPTTTASGPAVPRFGNLARIKAAAADIASIGLALKMFEMNCGRFPTTAEGLKALLEQPAGVTGWEGPYLDGKKGLPQDPWGRPYVYKHPGTHETDFDLYSLGSSGQDGAADNIGNWPKK